ncbi:TonB-dependent receptor [Novosphingobium sp. ZN18A2]|uniref:TonB-dependent receptor n=1 Tax=Novosphingobium sp. ZN18A2 TaxID=3079861 RepID=UPI0030CBC780
MTGLLPALAAVLAGAAGSETAAGNAPPAHPIVVTAPGGAIDADEADGIARSVLEDAPRPDIAATLQREVPGITLSDPQGNPWQVGISWRGYTVSALQGTEQGIAVYLDGIRFNQPFGDTLSLDLVPQAALVRAEVREASPVYGRNALGGVLLLQSATGRDLPGVRASGWVDGIGGVGGSASLGWSGDGGHALAIAEVVNDPGWRVSSPSQIYRLALSGGIDRANWGMTVRVNAADTDLGGNGVAPVQLLDAKYNAVFTLPDSTRTRYARIAALPWLALTESTRVEGAFAASWIRRKSSNGDLADFGQCETDAGFLCLADNAGNLTERLLNASGAPLATVPGIDEYAVINRGDELTRSQSAALQLLDERDTERGKRRIAIGLSYERASTRFRAGSELGELGDGRVISGLGPVITSADGSITPVDVQSDMSDFALFASAEVPLSRRLRVELGARWAANHVRLTDRIGTALNGAHTFRRLNPSVEFDYALASRVSLNAGYAETSRTPTPAELSCADPQAPCALASFFVADPPLRQVVARRWSAGAQGGADALKWHIDVWRSDASDDIRHVASGVRGRAYFINGGRSRRQGVDLGATWTKGPWRINAGYAFTDARFREGFTISSPANPAADSNGSIAVMAGDRIPGIPRHTANLSIAYSKGAMGLSAGLRAQSSQVLIGDEGNDNAPVPGFAVVDLGARYTLVGGITLKAGVSNLFDRHYATFGTFSEVSDIALTEAPGANDPRAYAPGAPRRLTVSLSVSL